ncbi:MAG: paraslipin [Nitrospirae bacterium]|nr:paraslipin [Nitrospirota bacterium]MBI3595209.1 paraslipin [Nitrospirota bacterium]
MTIGLILLVILTFIVFAAGVCTVPQQSAWVVERLGKYHATLTAGLNFIIPFVDSVRYKHVMKEISMEIPEQVCITKDNVQVGVDGVLFLRIIDAKLASYGIGNYIFAVTQLAQTTLRSEIGKITLDKTFEERQNINMLVVTELDKATEPWGVKVLRYEIKNINPPKDVLGAMEKQMRAEREKRSLILTSEGERDAKINRAEGDKQQVIKNSEATKQLQINEAEGRAEAILSVARATAEAIRQVGQAISGQGGMEAINLRVAEQWVGQFGNIAKESTTLILPANLGEVGSMVATALTTIKKVSGLPAQEIPKS